MPESLVKTTKASLPTLRGAAGNPEYNRFGVFAECPLCGESMAAEHAHYRCTGCGWRDSCCD